MDDLLRFWFGSADLTATPAPDLQTRWFRVDPAFDEELRARFGALLDAPVEDWATGPAGALAAVLVLDQLPRNLHRGHARAFASDARARAVADRAIAAGWDAALGVTQRVFLYLPFEHAEDPALQERSIALFRALGDPFFLSFAEQHQATIARFGRFPARNKALGRVDTPDEAA